MVPTCATPPCMSFFKMTRTWKSGLGVVFPSPLMALDSSNSDIFTFRRRASSIMRSSRIVYCSHCCWIWWEEQGEESPSGKTRQVLGNENQPTGRGTSWFNRKTGRRVLKEGGLKGRRLGESKTRAGCLRSTWGLGGRGKTKRRV